MENFLDLLSSLSLDYFLAVPGALILWAFGCFQMNFKEVLEKSESRAKFLGFGIWTAAFAFTGVWF